MKNLNKLSKKAAEWCELSGYNIDVVRENMKSNSFAVQVCETKAEMDENGVDYSFPYVLWNPYNMNLNASEFESEDDFQQAQINALREWQNSDNNE